MVTGANVNSAFTANNELLNIQLPLEYIPHNEIMWAPTNWRCGKQTPTP